MNKQVIVTVIKPKTLEHRREYFKRLIREVDDSKRKLKSDINAVSTNATARNQVKDMGEYIIKSKERLSAFHNQRETLQRSLSRINKTISNRNREMSGRKTI